MVGTLIHNCTDGLIHNCDSDLWVGLTSIEGSKVCVVNIDEDLLLLMRHKLLLLENGGTSIVLDIKRLRQLSSVNDNRFLSQRRDALPLPTNYGAHSTRAHAHV
jgi:hypothetical protein